MKICLLMVPRNGFGSVSKKPSSSMLASIRMKNPNEEIHCGSVQDLIDNLHPSEEKKKKWKAVLALRGSQGSAIPNGYGTTFAYIKKNGLYMEPQYPLRKGKDVNAGKFVVTLKPNRKIFIRDYVHIPSNQHKVILEQLKVQPLVCSVAVGTTLKLWGKEDEVYPGLNKEEKEEHEAFKKKHNVADRHAFLLVGHGYKKGKLYYYAQGTWGTGWGHKGYIKLDSSCISNVWYPVGTKVKEIKVEETKKKIETMKGDNIFTRRCHCCFFFCLLSIFVVLCWLWYMTFGFEV